LSGDPGANTFYLEQAALHLIPELASSIGRLDIERAFRTLWASPRSVTPHRILSGHEDSVYAVAVGSVGGRTLVVSGSKDGTVCLWDPERPVAEPGGVRGHGGRGKGARPSTRTPEEGHRGHDVFAVAMGSLAGTPLVVSGGRDGTVCLWDPELPDAEPVVLRG